MNILLLAAGLGTRLMPLTRDWPKCLMPINKKPLLEYWIDNVSKFSIHPILINTHYKHDKVANFAKRDKFDNKVKIVYESKLLGTAGTIRNNYAYLKNDSVMVIHADNLCVCNFKDFINYHNNERPKSTLMTMMTFKTNHPKDCGVVELDENGILHGFYEKVDSPPGNTANGAVYIIEPEVVDWIHKRKGVSDFSTQVIPNFIGKIATWENCNIHKDIGTIEELKNAQNDVVGTNNYYDKWMVEFMNNPVHKFIYEDK